MAPTNVYVDGFNLYFRSLRRTPFKWLDLRRLARLLVPHECEINRVRYYTARVSGRPDDPDAPRRQQTYLRALRTLPNLTIAFGRFMTTEVSMPLAQSIHGRTRTVRVLKIEEKGSDVNLACDLLLDAFRGDCKLALVISNDSDLLEPIRIVRHEFGIQVGIGCPSARVSQVLANQADFIRHIRAGALRASQFAPVLRDARGEFTKPRSW